MRMSQVRVDHLIYAVADLDRAAARFLHEFGLASVVGGRHPGWGTANRIVPLGRDYLELIGVADAAEAAASDFGRWISEATASGDRLVGWAVATDDLDAIASRLGLEIAPGSRARPDGSTLRWRLAGLARALTSGAYPLFVEWEGPPEVHPGRAAAEHRVEPRDIAWIEVSADEHALGTWLGDGELPLRIVAGPDAISAAAIGTDQGEIVLRS
jgi:Glyoxalase-like domain